MPMDDAIARQAAKFLLPTVTPPNFADLIPKWTPPKVPDLSSIIGNSISRTMHPLANISGLHILDPVSEEEKLRSRLSLIASDRARLEEDLRAKDKALADAVAKSKAGEASAAEVERVKAERDHARQELSQRDQRDEVIHLIGRVSDRAGNRLLDDEAFRKQFEEEVARPTFVMSIDVRRSTELMLKARKPKLFAEFIHGLAVALRQIVLNWYGVFDKFTGDGILAFFPDFYSGPSAGYFALQAAAECHEAFKIQYQLHRKSFSSVLLDVGLGIGLDFGDVHIVKLGNDLTVVGEPVVFACRMAGCEAGSTYANEPAFEKLSATCDAVCEFEDAVINVKHDGRTLAHRVKMNGRTLQPTFPDWAGIAAPAATTAEGDSGPQPVPVETAAPSPPTANPIG